MTAVFATPAHAQSDGSLEDTYRQQCAQNSETQLCKTLREALQKTSEEAKPAEQPPAAGATILDITDQLARGDRSSGGLRYDQHRIAARPGVAYEISLEATDPIQAKICTDEQPLSFSCFGRLDYATVKQWAVQPTGDFFVTVFGRKNSGTYRLKVVEVPVTAGWVAEINERHARLRSALRGQIFTGINGQLAIHFAEVHGEIEARFLDGAKGNLIRAAPLGAFTSQVFQQRYRLNGHDQLYNVASLIGANGIATVADWGFGESYALTPTGDLAVTLFGSLANYQSYSFRRMAPADGQRFLASYEAKRAAAASRGGNSGFLGAVMAGAGAVMAGGNAGQVLGAATQGAQMADPGGSTASALGQVAGAVGAPQIDFRSALTGGAAGGSSAGGNYPTRPNLALGSCPGFSEDNYRTYALSAGDVQRKTMCGQAFEFYTMYKRAIAQGYSEDDANRTYAAHEGAVANLRSFVGN